jgi:type I restriction enzyme M protein
MLHNELKSKIRKLWDRFWSNGIANPLQAIEQMSYLIFMKKLEDEDEKRKRETEFAGGQYESVFKGQEKCKWSEWSGKSASEILDFVRDNVFPFMRNMGDKDSLYSRYMENANFTIPTSSLLIEAVGIINDMHIKEQNHDTQGDMYEYLLSELQSSGKNGQFRTPRHIINMMVKLVDPQLGEVVLDPACGTAGFLVEAYNHVLEKNRIDGISTIKANKKRILDEESIYGFDIDDTMTRIALMNLMMHGIKRPNIERMNTLSRRGEEKLRDNAFDVILANPPFKGSINPAEVSGRFEIKSKKTELLFLELMHHVLSPHGRCAVIVPDGVLFGNSNAHKRIREKLLKDANLEAIISMPSGVFKPYAGVSTAILIFKKGESTKKVWFYDMQNDGFSLDDKRNEIEGSNIPEIIEKFKIRYEENSEDRKSKYFFIPIEEIGKNDWDLSINKYKEIEYEEPDYRASKVILKEVKDNLKDISKEIEDLEQLI